MIQSLKDGDSTVEEMFGEQKASAEPPKPREKYDTKEDVQNDLLKGAITKEPR